MKLQPVAAAPIAHQRPCRRVAPHTIPAARAARSTRPSATTFAREAREAREATLAKKKVGVRERFATLEQRFIPSKAKGVNASWQFDLSGDDGGKWYVTIKDGKITVKSGTGGKADVTIKAKASDYRKIADGEMSSTMAFLTGKVKIDGEKDLAKKFKEFFREP